MMWIFEWDIVTGDSAALGQHLRGEPGPRRRGDRRGRRRRSRLAGRMRDLVAATDPATWRDPRCARASGARSTTRSTCSRRWARTGPWCCGTRSGWTPATHGRLRRLAAGRGALPRGARRARRRATAATWTCPRTTSPPPTSARVRADRDPAMAWVARVLLVDPARALLLGAARARRFRAARRALRALLLGGDPAVAGGRAARRPTRPGRPGAGVGCCPAVVLVREPRGVHLVRRAGAPAGDARRLAAVRPGAAAARRRPGPVPPVGGDRRRRAAAQRAAAGGAGGRGPGRYWFAFWTAPTLRAVVHHRRVRRVLLAVRGRRRGAARRGTGCVRRRAVGATMLARRACRSACSAAGRRASAWSAR